MGVEPNTKVRRVWGVHSIQFWRAVRSLIFDYSVVEGCRLDWHSALYPCRDGKRREKGGSDCGRYQRGTPRRKGMASR